MNYYHNQHSIQAVWCRKKSERVCVCAHLRSGVHDIDEAVIVVGFADGLQHVLILQTASAEA